MFRRIFLNENVRISIKISLKFVPKGPINNIPALVQKMAWRRPGDKPLSEPLTVSLLMHICATRPQWVKQPYLLVKSYLELLMPVKHMMMLSTSRGYVAIASWLVSYMVCGFLMVLSPVGHFSGMTYGVNSGVFCWYRSFHQCAIAMWVTHGVHSGLLYLVFSVDIGPFTSVPLPCGWHMVSTLVCCT